MVFAFLKWLFLPSPQSKHGAQRSCQAVFYSCVLLQAISPLGHAIQPLELTAGLTRDTSRAYDGIDGFAFTRLETHLTAPLLKKIGSVGSRVLGADLIENRLFLSGLTTATRRLYRFSMPIQYFPRAVGRFQHEWMLDPAYYSDESFTAQKRYSLEYAWQLRYQKSRKVSFIAGFRKDSRFGASETHPIFGIEARPNKRIFHHWVFPDVYTNIQLNKKMAARGFLKITGGNWKYLQPDESTATFAISDWRLGVSLRIKTKMPFDLVGEAGFRFLGEGAAAGTTGSCDNSYFIGVGINTPFDVGTKRPIRRR